MEWTCDRREGKPEPGLDGPQTGTGWGDRTRCATQPTPQAPDGIPPTRIPACPILRHPFPGPQRRHRIGKFRRPHRPDESRIDGLPAGRTRTDAAIRGRRPPRLRSIQWSAFHHRPPEPRPACGRAAPPAAGGGRSSGRDHLTARRWPPVASAGAVARFGLPETVDTGQGSRRAAFALRAGPENRAGLRTGPARDGTSTTFPALGLDMAFRRH